MREFDEKNKVPSVSLQFSNRSIVTVTRLAILLKMADKESVTQRKIIEVRRKISLCEGKRRAVYNLCRLNEMYIRLIFSLHFYPL